VRRTPTVRALLEEATARLESAPLSYGHGTMNALDEAAWLVLHALGLPIHELEAHLEDSVSATGSAKALALVERRIRTKKPAAYLLHEAWLGPHRFYVDERVIVPRSFIAELLRKWGKRPVPQSALDLCTGSGCLAILCALAFPEARVDAADLSAEALAVAARNVDDYQLERRVRLAASDMFSALRGRTYDLIVSNPPYVRAASMRKLPDEYRAEPVMALASGTDGLEHTRTILREAKRHLRPGGTLVVEIGHNRKALEKAYPALPFEWPRTSGGKGYVFVLRREDL
jgi:ribosomal protein L3 glutamine methyltransferase